MYLRKNVIRGDAPSLWMYQVGVVNDVTLSADTDVCDILDLHETRGCVVNINPKLSNNQTSVLQQLVGLVSDVFSEKLSVSNNMIHDIDLTSAVPVYNKPYPIHHSIRKTLDETLEGIKVPSVIDPSVSHYYSPIVLVRLTNHGAFT